MNTHYAILGSGAVGGFYGARLQRSGQMVHFLLHSDYAHVCDNGLTVESIDGDFTLKPVNAYRTVQDMSRCDVIIIALKTVHNDLLSQLLPPLLKETSCILLLQNGVGVEEDIAKICGHQHKIISGLCFLCSNKIGPGHICHLDYGRITLGAYRPNYEPAGITADMERLATDFRQAGISVTLTEDLLEARWQKLLWNIPFNGLSVVLNANTDEIMANDSSRQLAEQLMQEVVLAAQACGRQLPAVFLQNMLIATANMKPYKTSMKLDYEAKRPLEIEAIFGKPLQIAARAGVYLPRISTLYQQLQFLDMRNTHLA